MARAGRMLPKATARRRARHGVSVTAHPVSTTRMGCVQWGTRADLMAWVQWATWPDLVAWAQWATVVAAVGRLKELECALSSAHNERYRRKTRFTENGGPLNLGRSPELFESAWPTSVGYTVSSGVRHALAQRSIGHERSNRACQVFDVMRLGNEAVGVVFH